MEECFKHAFDLLREPIFILNGSSNCVFANRALYSFFGMQRGEDEEVITTEDFWPDAHTLSPSQSEAALEFRTRSGDTFLAKITVERFGEGFRLVRVVSGHSKSDPLQTFHSQRLETLGMLAGGVAHDFNNILTGILGHITYLKTILPRAGNHVESLSAIEDGARKGSSITQQILNFSKLNLAEKATRLDLGDLAVRTCSLLRRAISPEYVMECHVPNTAIMVLGIEGQLAQVIVNLVINARDAVSRNGKISIEVSLVEDRGEIERVFHGLDLSSRSYARLVVADNGSGIAPDVIDRVFEPYFSTKKDKGTGLGLATVNGIVKGLGGAIDIRSREGKGTTVAFYLPVVEGGADTGTAAKPASGVVKGNNERILVVDDEYPVRNVLCVSLEHLGYRVEVAASGMEAMEIYSKAGAEKFDLVLMDMLMPQMTGEQLFRRLKNLDPSVKVLAISGFTSEDSIRSVLDNGGCGFIQKPFTIDELSRQVRMALDKE